MCGHVHMPAYCRRTAMISVAVLAGLSSLGAPVGVTSRLIVFFTRYTVCMYACHTACSFGTCNNDLICNWTAFHLASLLIELGYLSPDIDGFTLIYSTSDGLNWNIFHCYGRNHNATSHAGSIKRGMRTIKGNGGLETRTLLGMSSGRSRNRATMITNMIKSGIFVSPYRDTSQSNGDSRRK